MIQLHIGGVFTISNDSCPKGPAEWNALKLLLLSLLGRPNLLRDCQRAPFRVEEGAPTCSLVGRGEWVFLTGKAL